MSKVIINIFEKSYLIAIGLKSLLNGINNFEIEIKINDFDNFEIVIEEKETSIIILNTEFYDNLTIKLIEKIKLKKNIVLLGVKNFNSNFKNKIFENYIQYNEHKNKIEEKIVKLLKDEQFKKSNKKKDKDKVLNEINELSKREKSILELLAKGLTNKEIAEKLFISIHTVTTHRKNIVKKLDIRTLSGLTVYAILNKIVDMNDLK